MKRLFLLLQIIWSSSNLFAQKLRIEPSMYDKIPYTGFECLSNDGKYIAYDTRIGAFPGLITNLVIQSTFSNWKFEIPKGIEGKITADSKHWLFMKMTDSLGILNLNNKKLKYIGNVSNFMVPENGSGEWLIYELNNLKKTLFLYNLRTGKEKKFSDVSTYQLDMYGENLVILSTRQKETGEQSIVWLNLTSGKNVLSWSGKNIHNLVLDFSHKQLAFKKTDSVYYYKNGMPMPNLIMAYKDTKLNLGDLKNFSNDGKRLHLTLFKDKQAELIGKVKEVEIWSYSDHSLQSVQSKEPKNKRLLYEAVVLLNNHKLVNLQPLPGEYILKGLNDKFALSVCVDSNAINFATTDGGYWNSTQTKRTFYLTNTNTGEKKVMDWLGGISFQECEISPEGKYLVCYSPKYKGYLSYNITTGKVIHLTSGIVTKWAQIECADNSYLENYARGIAGWLPDDRAVLIYDRNDIWRLDPLGEISPLNLTNGYGLKNQVIFKLGLYTLKNLVSLKNDDMILSAFNLKDKTNGFYKKNINKHGNPESLTMGPYIYTQVTGFMPSTCMMPIKAKDSDIYMVQRMSATEPPNYFITRDFKTFSRITNFKPEVKYNWYTTELHEWRSLDGRNLQGILYKPEDFDPRVKYPVIFCYYERKSDRLNAYLEPKYSEGEIDIATYVSNGYLVFTPDIYFPVGDPMQGTYNALVSAARYVSTLPFVNPQKMGIQGHSFGGVQTNYLVTHTNLFAAACSASGLSDFISGYGSLSGNTVDGYGASLTGVYETGQVRMGSSLWENPVGYLKNSSILHVDKVATPLLIEHGKNDEICPYANTMEFFLGLRRLGKKAWMLVYPEAGHALVGKDAEDFTLRMQQFFDHYLKGKPAPMWMLDLGSGKNRGTKAELELDTMGRIPGPGLLTREEQNKVDSLMTRKQITVVLK